MHIHPSKLIELIAFVRTRFPGLTSVLDERFEREETGYKREASALAQKLLNRSDFERLLAAADYVGLERRLRKVAGATNLLYLSSQKSGDLQFLYQEAIPVEQRYRLLFELLHGAGAVEERMAAFLSGVETAGGSVRWPFITYLLFVLYPETEIFFKATVLQSFLRFLDVGVEYASKPSAELYVRIREVAHTLRDDLGDFDVKDMIDVQSLMWVYHDVATDTSYLGEPFREIFGSVEGAMAALDLVATAARRLGVTGPEDERFTIAHLPDQAGIHFSFCNWLIVCFYALGRHAFRTRLALPLEAGALPGLVADGGIFSERPGHARYGLFGVLGEIIEPLEPRFAEPFLEGLDGIRELFAQQQRSPYRRYNNDVLGRAVFDTDQRGDILRKGLDVTPVVDEFDFGDPEYRVRTPYQYRSSINRAFMRAIEGESKPALMELFSRMSDLMGSPQNQVDWQDPDRWIPERLSGTGAELAMRIWKKSSGVVNPRHMRAAYLFATKFKFIAPDDGGLYAVTEVGRRYLDGDAAVVRAVDRLEGSEQILRLINERGQAQPADLKSAWSEFTKRHSKFQSAPTIDGALTARIRDLAERGLIAKRGQTYALTPEGLQYLGSLDAEPTLLVPPVDPPVREPYGIDDAHAGLFMTRETIEGLVDLLGYRKNVILQGPPGVGKTYIARRVAYALMKEKAPDRVEMVQFHQSYSYEDFIQGFRPQEGGGFALTNGVFFDFCRRAKKDPQNRYVFIVDEINRGNLSKIFGELMMLVESDKRGPDFAIPLTYSPRERFHVPENVHILGMMNTADRSLAMVDYALRRRFAFVEIEPSFNGRFEAYMLEGMKAPEPIVRRIVERLVRVNREIAEDRKNLGPGFRIGHSYFCNSNGGVIDEAWYERIVKFEIEPLLREYWFDNEDHAESLVRELLAGGEPL